MAVITIALFLQFSLKRMSDESPSPDLEQPTQPGEDSEEPTNVDRPTPIERPTQPETSTIFDKLTLQLQTLQAQLQTFTSDEVTLMADNALDKLNSALDDLSKILDEPAVKTALGAIPASVKTPIVEGLQKVLEVVKTTLKELQDKIASVVNLDKLFTTTTNLLDAAEGLATNQKSTLEDVKKVISTLQDVSQAKEKIAGILGKIDAIVAKLKAA
jgi:hypothetical protein